MFVSFAAGELTLFDRDYRAYTARRLAVSDTTLIGVGATGDRALLVFASASGSATVDYVQVCL